MTDKTNLSKDEIEQVISKEVNDFKKFAFQSSMIQMAVAFLLGAAFKNVVTALSEDLIMPFINFAIGKTGTDWRSLTVVPYDGITLYIGKFIGSFVDFLIVALVLYFIYSKLFGNKVDSVVTKT